MVKKISKGSLLGRSSSSSKDSTGLYLVSIVAIVAVVALFLMVKGGSSEVSGETVMVVDDEGNLIGEAFRGMDIKTKLNPVDILSNKEEDSYSNIKIDWESKAFETGEIFVVKDLSMLGEDIDALRTLEEFGSILDIKTMKCDPCCSSYNPPVCGVCCTW